MRAFATTLGIMLLSSLVQAHDPGTSEAQLRVRPDGATLTASFDPADVPGWIELDASRDSRLHARKVARAEATLKAIAKELFRFEEGAGAVAARDVSVSLRRDELRFVIYYERSREVAELRLFAPGLTQLHRGHRLYARALTASGEPLAEAVFNNTDPQGALTVPAAELPQLEVAGASEAAAIEPWALTAALAAAVALGLGWFLTRRRRT